MQQNENLKEQRKNYRQLTRVEKTGEELSDIMLTTNQLTKISRKVIDLCKDNGDTIALNKVLQVIFEDIKKILQQKQDEFIASHGIRLVVKDRPVIIRPIAPRDKTRFVNGVNQLSSDTIFLRFLSPIRELSSSQIDYLINVDYEDHFAVAVVADEPSYPGMAITRYIRSYSNPEEAEWAVTVIDQYQGLGLGRILLYLINKIAYEHGIKTFTATVHPTNYRILSWLEELNAVAVQTVDGRVWKFHLPIPDSFLNRPEIREKLQQIVDGKGDLPLYIASDMKQDSKRFEGLLCRLRKNERIDVLCLFKQIFKVTDKLVEEDSRACTSHLYQLYLEEQVLGS